MFETKLIPIRRVFTENQRTAVNRLFKKYRLNFTKKKLKIKRCDSLEIFKTCNCISLKDIDSLLQKIETKYAETKNMNIKESLNTVKKIKEDFCIFLKSTHQNEGMNAF
ncbi:hypothetical protein [Arcobacter sp. L]|uniref:hypothetical protein n=1 Tax=Arcobacter sp. L TaxID=944547 RepID=UPI000229647B|nr:hypothetical protein [Arcobacter sp. L]BAK73731.1 hypothetical protein ABLL_1856 [Arcobacter sp. L]